MIFRHIRKIYISFSWITGHFIPPKLKVPENIILFQPAHCPELNPIERLWEHLKDCLAWQLFNNLDALKVTVRNILNSWSTKLWKIWPVGIIFFMLYYSRYLTKWYWCADYRVPVGYCLQHGIHERSELITSDALSALAVDSMLLLTTCRLGRADSAAGTRLSQDIADRLRKNGCPPGWTSGD